jgi:hypothetical protein
VRALLILFGKQYKVPTKLEKQNKEDDEAMMKRVQTNDAGAM